MKTKIRLTKKQIILKEKADKKSNRILILVGLGLVLMIISSWGFQFYKEYKEKNAYKEYIGKEVPKDFVCMSGDLVKHNSTIQVDVAGRIYQVCCKKCENKLKSSTKYRFAVDPLTKETIDKSESFVVLDPLKEGMVTYFKTKENYLQFKKQNYNVE